MSPDVSVVPRRTTEPADAGRLLVADGAVIVGGGGTDPGVASATIRAITGERLVGLAGPVLADDDDERSEGLPDVVGLLRRRTTGPGPTLFLVEAGRLVRWLDAEEPALARFLYGRSAIVRITDGGRRCVRTQPGRAAIAPEHLPMLNQWSAAIATARAGVERFRLGAGELLLVDNYRVWAGHDSPARRTAGVWRIDAWTTDSFGVPDGVELAGSAAKT